MIDLRLVSSRPEDDHFLFQVFTAAKPGAGAAWGTAPAQANDLLRMQFAAQQAGYRARFPRAEFSIIHRGPVPVGSMIVDRSRDEIRLVDIALLPQFRGLGIGTSLLQVAQTEAEAAGLPVRLSVARDNRALSLYGRLGFCRVADDGVYLKMEWRPRNGPPPSGQGIACGGTQNRDR